MATDANHKYSMETFVMLIMLLHLGPDSYPYTTTMVQDPQQQYTTLTQCEQAAVAKRTEMLLSSGNYPTLGIIDVKITCLPTELMGTDPMEILI